MNIYVFVFFMQISLFSYFFILISCYITCIDIMSYFLSIVKHSLKRGVLVPSWKWVDFMCQLG